MKINILIATMIFTVSAVALGSGGMTCKTGDSDLKKMDMMSIDLGKNPVEYERLVRIELAKREVIEVEQQKK
jgi:hypothetical protein